MNLLTEWDQMDYFLKMNVKFKDATQLANMKRKLKKKDMTDVLTQITYVAFNASKHNNNNNMIMAQPITPPVTDNRCFDLERQLIDKEKQIDKVTKDKDKQIKQLTKAPKEKDKEIKELKTDIKRLKEQPKQDHHKTTKLQSELKDMNKTLDGLRARYQNQMDTIENNQQTINYQKDEIEELRERNRRLQDELDKAKPKQKSSFTLDDFLNSYSDSDED
mgnify:FL=1